jgi:hypothetical protein
MTPQELAAMQAGLDPRAYYQDPYAAARAGLVDPETLPTRGATPIVPRGPQLTTGQRAQEFATSAMQKVRGGIEAAGTALGAVPTGRLGLIGGMVAPVMGAIEEAQAGRPTGAAGALLGGGAGVAAGAAVAKMLPGAYGKIASAVLPAIGGMIGAPVAAQASESVRQKATGEPTKGKEGEFSTQMAMAKQMGELGATQYRNQMGTYTSAIKDLSTHYSNQSFLDLQRNVPIIEKMKNNELIRQQALMNTQGQLQSQLGVLATAGALAQGAQAETGATLRTALTAAPYAGSVLQAPQIRFG